MNVLQSCPTLCCPMDCSPPVSSSIEFSKQEYWSGLPFLTPENLPDPRIEPKSLAPPSLVDRFLTTQHSGKPKKDDATTELVPTYILCTYIFSSTRLQVIWEQRWGSFLFSLSFQQSGSSVQFISVAQLCPTLCDPMDCSTPGLPVHHQLNGHELG